MISVIVPFKNAEEWIGRCVESLKAQTAEAEFILVNDHSSDEGYMIAKDLTKGDRRFILRGNNRHKRGVSGARNTGLDVAKGEWITFLDADDEMLPGALDIYERMISESDANIIMTNHLRYYWQIDKTALKYTNAGGWYGLNNLPILWCMVWNKCYNSKLVQDHGIRFDESMRYGEDEMFNLECLAIDNRIHHAAEDVATVRRHFDNRHSLVKSKTEEDLFLQAKALMDYITRNDDPIARRAACELLSEHWGSKTYLTMFTGDPAPPSRK